ncbi:MAG: hypothetical protein GY906_19780 [bacterium]|nr:hypothetical protein [bacterium]
MTHCTPRTASIYSMGLNPSPADLTYTLVDQLVSSSPYAVWIGCASLWWSIDMRFNSTRVFAGRRKL